MNILPNEELNRLIKASASPCVSVFLHTHSTGAERDQDPIRFKNLVREAEEQLLASDISVLQVKKMLAPVYALLSDSFFWRHQNDGLAVFVSPDIFRYYRLPLTFGENVFVGSKFTITPLLPLFVADGRFYILAISKKHIRLFNCTRHSAREVELLKVPKSIDDLMRYSLASENVSVHSGGSYGGESMAYQSHSGGRGDSMKKNDVLSFFHQVDRYLHKFLDTQQAPMVLAGVDYEQAIYRDASSYPNLISKGVNGCPDKMSTEELHNKAWEIIEPYFKNDLEKSIMQFRQGANTDRTSNSLAEIVEAAHHGKIENLFVTVGLQKWGKFDAQTNTVTVNSERQRGDESLQNLAAVNTLSKGGKVYVVNPDEAPDEAPLCATYRY